MKRKSFTIILIILFLGLILTGLLIRNKNLGLTQVFAQKYELKGIDVSHYQGTIDWEMISEQGVDFAFIKATEGSSHVDECFEDNWKAAQQTDLYIGAYHFFSFDSRGKTQAVSYIETVGNLSGKLAPVIDVEYYGDKESNPPDKEEVTAQLKEMLAVLEEHYQKKPIIYTTYTVYHDYIKDEFEEYPLWIRNVYFPPFFKKWTFWQYTDTAVLEGYKGTEKFIDMNVFKGTREELKKMMVPEYDVENGHFLQTLNIDPDEADLVVTDNRKGAELLGYTDKETFLKDFDFEGQAPFYQYFEEDGELQLELYYDGNTGRGCGIRYYPGEVGDPQGFVFNGSNKSTHEVMERLNADPYDMLARGGIDLSQYEDIKDYEEEIEYTDDGRLKYFRSQGWLPYVYEEKIILKLLEIELTYREDGTLKERVYAHNTVILETWYSVVYSFYDLSERLTHEHCYVTHGSVDYYYIYDGNNEMPGYCLILDHNLNLLCAELLSDHEFAEDEDGKIYGTIGPDLSENRYADAVRIAGNYGENKITHTYINNYDGDKYNEAFVIIGNYTDMWGEPAKDEINGDLWFVDHEKNAVKIETATFRTWQEYTKQDDKVYLFLNHSAGLSWITDIYTVQENEVRVLGEEEGLP